MSKLIISKSKFFHNLNFLKNNINSKIAAVIKDNAYGHGISEISDLLVEFGIDTVFVKNNIEAHAVSDKFKSITILYPTTFENLAPHMFVCVQNPESISQIPPHTGIELKINTGMNRNGIDICDLDSALDSILERNLRLIGVFTHNAYGDSEGKNLSFDFIAQQRQFNEVKKQCINFAVQNKIDIPRFHSLSSSGALKAFKSNLADEFESDLVRIGIAMYGYLGAPLESDLKPIAELWADRISTHALKSGAKIGYEGKSVLSKNEIVSSYDIGYGDGFFRINESHNLRTKEGFLMLARMSMDCVSIESGEQSVCVMHDANLIARAFNTIPYEVLCKISPTITRIIKE